METKFWHKELSNIHPDAKIGEDGIIHSHVWIGAEVVIGNRVKIQAFCFIPDGITIEDDVFIGPGVKFANDKYPPSSRTHWAKTVVRKGAAIGINAIILPGVEIGECAMIGAGSIVTKSVPAGEVWYGNPARKAKKGYVVFSLDDIYPPADLGE